MRKELRAHSKQFHTHEQTVGRREQTVGRRDAQAHPGCRSLGGGTREWSRKSCGSLGVKHHLSGYHCAPVMGS